MIMLWAITVFVYVMSALSFYGSYHVWSTTGVYPTWYMVMDIIQVAMLIFITTGLIREYTQ